MMDLCFRFGVLLYLAVFGQLKAVSHIAAGLLFERYYCNEFWYASIIINLNASAANWK
jgi:hypothetical protein